MGSILPEGSVCINGRFLLQELTGVQRFATELLLALDVLLNSRVSPGATKRFQILTPRGGARLKGLVSLKTIPCGAFQGRLWEQIELPLCARNAALLVNLAGGGPVALRHQIAVIPDMSVFDVPGGFSVRYRIWYRLVFRVLARRATRILTYSNFSRDRIRELLRVEESRIFCVPLGCDHIERIRADESICDRIGLTRGRYCVAVAGNNPNKNARLAIDAMRTLESRGTPLRLAIVGSTHPSVFAEQSGGLLPRNCVNLGYVSDGELKALYSNALCLVFPSRYEGFGLPPLEAMACGTPVITWTRGAIREVCGDAALYCESDSSESWADAICSLLNDPVKRGSLKKLGLENAARFNWAETARLTLDHIDTVLRASRP